jgi:prepilin-type N-terminal cleavage/methylation domain-containing protein
MPVKAHSSRAAFTLMEVVIALAIVAVAIPAFLRVVQGAIDAGRVVEFAGREQLAFEGAVNYIEAFLGRMPSEAVFTFQKDADGTRVIVQNVFSAPGETLRRRDGWNTHLDARLAPNGSKTLLTRALPQMLDSTRSPVPDELPLIRDLGDVRWRFYLSESSAWVDEFPEGTRPALVELNLTSMEGLKMPRLVFWVCPRTATEYDN